jgi:hypothetical protein
MECECGEIFGVPIVPENPPAPDAVTPKSAVTTKMPGFTKEPKFDIPDGFSPVFSKFVRMVATSDDRVRSQYEAHCAEQKQKRNDVADAAAYAVFAADRLMARKALNDECPMCDSNAVWQGDYGRECGACGEIFEVPIVPENAVSDAGIPESATITKMPKFIISDAARTPSFVDLLNKYFAPLGRE